MRLKLDSEKWIFLLLIAASGSKRENNMALNLYLLLMLPGVITCGCKITFSPIEVYGESTIAP